MEQMKRVPTPPPPPPPEPVIVEEAAETSEEPPKLDELVEPDEEPPKVEEEVQLMTILHSRPSSPPDEDPLPPMFVPPLVIVSAATDTVETTATPPMNIPEEKHNATLPVPAPAARERKIPRAPMKTFHRRNEKR